MTGGGRPPVFFHIGAPKTGSTYLQQLLWKNRALLRRDGVLYPGQAAPAHFWASLDLREVPASRHPVSHVPGSWDRLVHEVRAWGRPAVIDHESFVGARAPARERAMRDLGFADVHLVVTVRDLARLLPSVWQEQVKNGRTTTFADFVAAVRDPAGDRTGVGRRFWSVHDIPAALSRWSRHLPPERVHVVPVPPRGSEPGLLWRRFAHLLGLDPDRYDTDVDVANASLGAAEASVLRRLNMEIEDADVRWSVYARTVKHGLGPVLASRRSAGIALAREDHDWAVARSEQIVKALSEAGYDVVGDLDELVPGAPVPGEDPEQVPVEAQADAAVAGLAALVSRVDREADRRSLRVSGRAGLPEILRRQALALCGRSPWLGRLHGRYLRRRWRR